MSTLLKSLREKNRAAIIDRLIQQLNASVDAHRIERVYLFGSWARDDFDGYSDIDLLVILRPGVSDQEVELELGELDQGRAVDIVFTYADEYAGRVRRGDPFFCAIDKDRLPLWPLPCPDDSGDAKTCSIPSFFNQ